MARQARARNRGLSLVDESTRLTWEVADAASSYPVDVPEFTSTRRQQTGIADCYFRRGGSADTFSRAAADSPNCGSSRARSARLP